DLPLRRRLQDRDLSLHVGQVDLAVGGDRRRVVLAERFEAPSLLQRTARCRVEGRNDPSGLHQIQDVPVDQGSGYVWQVLLEPPEDGGGGQVPTGAGRTDGDGAVVSDGEIPGHVPFFFGDEVVAVRVDPAEVLAQFLVVTELAC